ncbi:hypothetical protein A2U01_0062439, partial [Trifolium medium]|nr:hypothetical protein [Trifolium medium]
YPFLAVSAPHNHHQNKFYLTGGTIMF